MKYPNSFLNKVICGNSIEIMRGIGEIVDITITSPPYNIGLKYDTYEDNISSDEYYEFSHDWIDSVYAITKETGRLYCVLDDKLIYLLKPIAEEIGWTYAQMLTWCKPNFSSGTKRISSEWHSMSEYALLFRKGKRTPMCNPKELKINTHNWFVETVPQSNFKKDYQKKVHPAQMPVSLVRKWVARTPGQVVLDPFCGAGSVCMAAKELGRDYIGIDISENYCDLARQRIMEV